MKNRDRDALFQGKKILPVLLFNLCGYINHVANLYLLSEFYNGMLLAQFSGYKYIQSVLARG